MIKDLDKIFLGMQNKFLLKYYPLILLIKQMELESEFCREKGVMLTQNYHALYQFLDDHGTCSPASEENVLICQKEFK